MTASNWTSHILILGSRSDSLAEINIELLSLQGIFSWDISRFPTKFIESLYWFQIFTYRLPFLLKISNSFFNILSTVSENFVKFIIVYIFDIETIVKNPSWFFAAVITLLFINCLLWVFHSCTPYKKWGCPLRIFSVNVSKSVRQFIYLFIYLFIFCHFAITALLKNNNVKYSTLIYANKYTMDRRN